MSTQTIPTSKDSSNACAVEFRPVRRSRNLVLLGGWLLLLAGFVLSIHANVTVGVRVLLTLAWLVLAGREIDRQARAYRLVQRVRLERQGYGTASGPQGRFGLRVLAGSLLLYRCVWLRLRVDDGPVYGELVLASDLGDHGWRRLNLLWHHDLKR